MAGQPHASLHAACDPTEPEYLRFSAPKFAHVLCIHMFMHCWAWPAVLRPRCSVHALQRPHGRALLQYGDVLLCRACVTPILAQTCLALTVASTGSALQAQPAWLQQMPPLSASELMRKYGRPAACVAAHGLQSNRAWIPPYFRTKLCTHPLHTHVMHCWAYPAVLWPRCSVHALQRPHGRALHQAGSSALAALALQRCADSGNILKTGHTAGQQAH